MSGECPACGRELLPFEDECEYCRLREENALLRGENALMRAGIERLVREIAELRERGGAEEGPAAYPV
jgi:uncharacterized OB-fold protein